MKNTTLKLELLRLREEAMVLVITAPTAMRDLEPNNQAPHGEVLLHDSLM